MSSGVAGGLGLNEASTCDRTYHIYNIRLEDVTDGVCSSGMCKAGFAGDDAPRAVFRKSFPSPQQIFVASAILLLGCFSLVLIMTGAKF